MGGPNNPIWLLSILKLFCQISIGLLCEVPRLPIWLQSAKIECCKTCAVPRAPVTMRCCLHNASCAKELCECCLGGPAHCVHEPGCIDDIHAKLLQQVNDVRVILSMCVVIDVFTADVNVCTHKIL